MALGIETEFGEEAVLVDDQVVTSPASVDDEVGLVTEEVVPAQDTENVGEDNGESTPFSEGQDAKDMEDKEEEVLERDFDTEPTSLYSLIHKKEWHQAIEYVTEQPEDAKVWVYRKEKDGALRWRLLPIHAAIIFKAPEAVVESLLAAYPKGAQAKDDQGMLPLHLAFRNGSSEGVVNLLLVAYPESIDVMDRKGRIPLVLAQASNSPHKEAFLRALERGPTYYAATAARTERAVERAVVSAEQKAMFDAKLSQTKQDHQHELAAVRLEAKNKQFELQNKLEEMRQELLKTQETSQVLVDHVNSLEAQLNSRSDTERFLATKIATLDSSLKNTSKSREEMEHKLKAENCQLTIDRDDLRKKYEDLENRYESVKSRLSQSLDLFESRENEWAKTERELSQEVKTIQIEWANAQATCAILDAQLKKKMEAEHALATQVSSLASQLAVSAQESRETSTKLVKRIRELEDERTTLRDTVHDLSKRLQLIVRLLEDMAIQQSSIIGQAKIHEDMVESTMEAHTQILADAMAQEVSLERARQEREQIRKMLDNQEEQVREGEKQRSQMMNAISVQGEHMEKTKKARDQIVTSVRGMGGDIDGLLQDVLCVIPKAGEKKDAVLVDTVINNIMNAGPERQPQAALVADTFTNIMNAKAGSGRQAPSTRIDAAALEKLSSELLAQKLAGGITQQPSTQQPSTEITQNLSTVDVVPQMSDKLETPEEDMTVSTESVSKATYNTGGIEDFMHQPPALSKIDDDADRIMESRGSLEP